MSSLLLRTLAFADQLSGAALESRLGLPFETLQPLIEEFQRAQLMDTVGFANEPGLDGRPIPVRMAYTVSSAGRQRAAEMAAVQTRYLGPCPVRYEDYLGLVRSQATQRAHVTDAALKKALGMLQLEQHVIDQIGGAMVSRSSLFIFGAPGNGKPFPDGSKMAKIHWDPKKLETFPTATVPASLHDVDFMVKDSKRFADSGGWGWAAFKYDAASDTFTPATLADQPPQGNDAKCGPRRPLGLPRGRRAAGTDRPARAAGERGLGGGRQRPLPHVAHQRLPAAHADARDAARLSDKRCGSSPAGANGAKLRAMTGV